MTLSTGLGVEVDDSRTLAGSFGVMLVMAVKGAPPVGVCVDADAGMTVKLGGTMSCGTSEYGGGGETKYTISATKGG